MHSTASISVPNFLSPQPWPSPKWMSDIDSRKLGSLPEQSPRSFTESDISVPVTDEHRRRNPMSENSTTPRYAMRPRNYGDVRWLQAGSSGPESRSSGQEDDVDIYHSRGVLYTRVNETNRQGAIPRSPSASQLHYTRNNSAPSMRQYHRPITRLPTVPSFPVSPSLSKQNCPCENSAKKNRADSIVTLAPDPETPEGLSWRRLHMSRAKLKATATTSELLSGFAMVAMVELQINKPTTVPEWLFVAFAVCTTILVSVHIFALMISTYLLPSIDAVSKMHVSSLVNESPHDRMKNFIELAWAFSTILGLLLFLVEIAILCWVKFWDYSFTAAMSATMIVIPVLVVFVCFAMHFYHSLVVIKCKTSVTNIEELENMRKQLDSIVP